MARPVSDNVTRLPTWRKTRNLATSRYTSEEFMERELERVFPRTWLAVAPLHKLAHAGEYVVLDEMPGESILATRDHQGRVRAFHNVCQHRASKLVRGCGRTDALVCPYHGWTYSPDGSLTKAHVPEGLSHVDTRNIRLREIRSDTWMGYIWVNLDGQAPPLLDYIGSQLVDELAPYQLDQMRPIQEAVWPMPANWKAMLENFTDFYHVPFVHRGSINRHAYGEPDLLSYGDHMRQSLDFNAYRWRRWLDSRNSRGGPYDDRQVSALHKYLIFPNFLINVLPYHLTVMQLWPDAPNRSKMVYSFLYREGAGPLERGRATATWLASRWILWEDLVILGDYQGGMDLGRNPTQLLNDLEQPVAHFQGVIDRYLTDPT